MQYIVNPQLKASYNIAMDEWLLTSLRPSEPIFTLWQNANAIIVGKHQNTFEEVNEAVVKDKQIEVVRRVTGGGAVYHDLGNLNFTFIIPLGSAREVNWKRFIDPMVQALHKLGIPAEIQGRNDLVVNGKKISGNAQRYANGYLMHHGTLLFDSDLEIMVRALNVSDEKFISKAVKSVRARVGNIKAIAPDLTLDAFRDALIYELSNQGQDGRLHLTDQQLAEVAQLEATKFATWSWNYGESPSFNYKAHKKFDGGLVTIKAQVANGLIEQITFEGDFLGVEDIDQLLPTFIGLPFSGDAIRNLLAQHQDKQYFGSIRPDEIASLVQD